MPRGVKGTGKGAIKALKENTIYGEEAKEYIEKSVKDFLKLASNVKIEIAGFGPTVAVDDAGNTYNAIKPVTNTAKITIDLNFEDFRYSFLVKDKPRFTELYSISELLDERKSRKWGSSFSEPTATTTGETVFTGTTIATESPVRLKFE